MISNILNSIISFTKEIPVFFQIILTILGFIIIGFSALIVTKVENGDKLDSINFKEDLQLRFWIFIGIIASPCCFLNLFPFGVICFLFIIIVHIVQILWCLLTKDISQNLNNELQNKNINNIVLDTKQDNQNNLTNDVVEKLIKGEINIKQATDTIAENDTEIDEQIQNSTFSEMAKDSDRLEQILKNIPKSNQ